MLDNSDTDNVHGFKPANLKNKSVKRILQAAMVCWTRDGYHGASMKEIADQAGVAKSLVHYHFESKEHLLIELQVEWCRLVARTVRKRISAGPPSWPTALAALDQVWDATVATRAQFPFAIEVWRQSVNNPAIRARVVAFDREIRALLVEGWAAALGPLADHLALPAARAVALLHAALDGFTLRLFLDDDVAAVRRTFDDFKTIFVAALVPDLRPAAAPPGGAA